jgi:hypothetical protein
VGGWRRSAPSSWMESLDRALIQVGIDPRSVLDAVWSGGRDACHVVCETTGGAETCGWLVHEVDPILGEGLPWQYVACDPIQTACIDPLIGPVSAPCGVLPGWRYLPLRGTVESVRADRRG